MSLPIYPDVRVLAASAQVETLTAGVELSTAYPDGIHLAVPLLDRLVDDWLAAQLRTVAQQGSVSMR